MKIVVPSALQMGWTESPPYFLAATETCRDIIDIILQQELPLSEHKFELHMEPNTRNTKRWWTQISGTCPQVVLHNHSTNVFVDEFCLAAVENAEGTWLTKVGRAALHAIHNIFPPPKVLKHQNEHVGQTTVLTGFPDPRRTYGIKEIDLPIS